MSWSSSTTPMGLAAAVMMVGVVAHAVYQARAAIVTSTGQPGPLMGRLQQLWVEAARELLVSVPLCLVGLIVMWFIGTVLDASNGAYVPHGVIR